jgi:hypothetical protein
MHPLPRSAALLASLIIVGTASAAAPGVQGPLVLRNADSQYVGVSADAALQTHAVRRPGGDELAYLWPADQLEALLEEDLAIVTMPANGQKGHVVNQRGECLSLAPFASSPSWLPCSGGFPRQVWLHRGGVLSMDQSVLDFIPYFSRRGVLAENRGEPNFKVVTALLRPVAEAGVP